MAAYRSIYRGLWRAYDDVPDFLERLRAWQGLGTGGGRDRGAGGGWARGADAQRNSNTLLQQRAL